jgi:ribosome-binding protein aMBF1 (putative translation factor)
MTNEDYKVKIGTLIQEARVNRGLTQAELATGSKRVVKISALR